MEVPKFVVDPSWPHIPNGWTLGQVSSAASDADGNIWIIHRSRTVKPGVKTGPPVMEFDPDGNYIKGWGGQSGDGYTWPSTEHGITVDYKGNIWISGNGNDDQILKFTKDGKFIMQIGHSAQKKTNADTTSLWKPADVFVYPKTNEIFVADGYGNKRVIVFDAKSGAYKRHWGAYGAQPSDDKQPPYDPNQGPAKQFGNPVHCVRLSNDGKVYVCDRVNNRIQVFEPSGKFLQEIRVEPLTLANGSVWDMVLSHDAAQKLMYVADGANGRVYVLNRADGAQLSSFGRTGRMAGEFKWVHNIAIDRQGNLYTSEVGFGRRVQKFVLLSF